MQHLAVALRLAALVTHETGTSALLTPIACAVDQSVREVDGSPRPVTSSARMRT